MRCRFFGWAVCAGLVMVAVGAVRAQQGSAQPVVKVVEDAGANGWTVRVSFRNAPEEFARAAHVWTLVRAMEIAEELKTTHRQGGHSEDLSVAEIRIEGKDGNGDVNADQGPHLPDWPLVEQQFRAHSKVRSAELDRKLAELKGTYEQAARAAEEVWRSREQIDTEADHVMRRLLEQFNVEAEELDDAFFGHHASPLPRLRLPEAQLIYEHAREWPNIKRIQHQAEELAREVRKQESEQAEYQKAKLAYDSGRAAETQTIVFDENQAKGRPGEAAARSAFKPVIAGEGQTGAGESNGQRGEVARIKRVVEQQLGLLENLLVDSSRINPPADGFSDDAATAFYKSTPSMEIRKVDAGGQDLADNQQPGGYPRPFLGRAVAGTGEGIFVEPSLRVQLISKSADKRPEVRAGVYGQVTAIDPGTGTVEMQVDSRGTRVIMSGFQPKEIKIGDFVEPARPIGSFEMAPRGRRTFEIVIRAINANSRLVSPGKVLEYATRKPKSAGQLDRDVEEPESAELPVKAPPADENGKPAETTRLIMDENAEKGANLKRAGLDLRESIARRDLERAKERESLKEDESGFYLARQRQVETEIKGAEEKVKAIEGQGDGVLAEAEQLTERKSALEKKLASLTDNKQKLDEMAARAKASNTDDDINAFNAEAEKHNQALEELKVDNGKLKRDESELSAKVGALTRERTKEQQRSKQLEQELTQMKAKGATAKSELEQARGDVKAREQELAKIQEEKQQMMQVAAEAKKDSEATEQENHP